MSEDLIPSLLSWSAACAVPPSGQTLTPCCDSPVLTLKYHREEALGTSDSSRVTFPAGTLLPDPSARTPPLTVAPGPGQVTLG